MIVLCFLELALACSLSPMIIFFRHDLSTFTGSLLLSEFECPRTSLIIIKKKQQQHIFIFIKKELEKNCCPRPSTRNPRPSTLDKKIDSPNLFVEGRGSRVEGSMSRVELNNHLLKHIENKLRGDRLSVKWLRQGVERIVPGLGLFVSLRL